MTMSKLAILIITLAAAARSCDKADFEKPQPDGVKNLTAMPVELKGKYFGAEDSAQMVVDDRSILVHRSDRHSMHVSQVDSVDRPKLRKDTSFYDKGVFLRLRLTGDSVRVIASYDDTLLFLPGGDCLRKYGKDYLLSKRIGDRKWDVKLASIKGNKILVKSTQTKEDIKALQTLLGTSDSTLIFNPNRAQFDKFVKGGGFRLVETFHKAR
jgi:hypothetical protein